MVGVVTDDRVVGHGDTVAVESLVCVAGVIADTTAMLARAKITERRMLKEGPVHQINFTIYTYIHIHPARMVIQ
jgi:hypothetical protein